MIFLAVLAYIGIGVGAFIGFGKDGTWCQRVLCAMFWPVILFVGIGIGLFS